jgi:AsmA protein
VKKLLLALLGVIVVVIAAAIVVPFLLPTETYKQQIEAQAERVTGRKLAIAGPLEFSVLPTVAVSAEDVRFANVAGGAPPDMVRLKSFEAELKIWPLLRGAVEVDRFVLIEPEFHLEVDAEGRPNWALGEEEAAPTEAPPQEEAAGETEAPPEAAGGMRLPVSEVKLGDIRIENGSLTYADARSGTEERIEAINLDLDLPDLRGPLEAKGSLGYKGETVAFGLAVERPLDLIQGGSSPVRVNSEAPDLALTFEGALDNAKTPAATGMVELNVTSIRDLAAWLAKPLTFEGEGLRTLRIAGKLTGSPTRIAFDDAKVALDAIEGQGNVAVDLSEAVPRLTGRLDLGAVDLNPYLPPAAAETGDQGSAPGREQAGGEARGGSGGWSDEPIELPPIGGAEVDFELAVDSMRMRELQLDRSVVAFRLKGAGMSADFKEVALYGGRGSGQLDVKIVEGAPRISEQFRLEGLQALPFLRDAAGFERLEGTANFEVSLKTRGRSQRELVENLDGEGEATFVDGAIVGINLAAMVRNVATAFQGGGGDQRKTDFAQLSGTFRVRNGILKNDDLWLQAPVMRVAGSGQVDLPERTVDYRIEPKAAQTLEGQGGEREVAGLLVPVIVRGPWDDLSFSPDVGDLARRALEDPEAVREQVEQLGDVGKAIKKGGAEKALEGLLGQGGGQGDKSGGSQGGDAAQKLLKGLFGN